MLNIVRNPVMDRARKLFQLFEQDLFKGFPTDRDLLFPCADTANLLRKQAQALFCVPLFQIAVKKLIQYPEHPIGLFHAIWAICF